MHPRAPGAEHGGTGPCGGQAQYWGGRPMATHHRANSRPQSNKHKYLVNGQEPSGPLEAGWSPAPQQSAPQGSAPGAHLGWCQGPSFWVTWVLLQWWLGPQEDTLAFLIVSGGHCPLPSPRETDPSPSAGRAPRTPPHPHCSSPRAPGRPAPRSCQEATRRPRTTPQMRVHGEKVL